MTKPMRALVVRVCLMVVLLGYVFRSPRVRIISIPQPIRHELLEVYALNAVSGPWVKQNDTYETISSQYTVLTPRIPYAGNQSVCVGDDGVVVNTVCPYAVDIFLDIPTTYDLPMIFGLIKVLHNTHTGTLKTLHIMTGGTVHIDIPHYSIILGRKQLVKRLLWARKILASPSWKHHEGILDLRYHDGFVYRQGSDVLAKSKDLQSKQTPEQVSTKKSQTTDAPDLF